MCINRLVKLNPVNFDEEVLCSDIPVLVGFCAPWSKAGRGVEWRRCCQEYPCLKPTE